MKTFTGELIVEGPRIVRARLQLAPTTGAPSTVPVIEASVSYDEDTGLSTITADVSQAQRGVWMLSLEPDPGVCCLRHIYMFVEGCPPTVIPGIYDSTARPTPIPTCLPDEVGPCCPDPEEEPA